MDETPASRVRNGWAGITWGTTAQDVAKLRNDFLKFKSELNDAIESDIDDKTRNEIISANQHAMFLYGIHLLSYGRVDIVDVVLDILPGALAAEGKVRFMRQAIEELLPVPDHLKPIKRSHPQSIHLFKEWYIENKHFLRWDEHNGKFVLDKDTGS